MQLVVKMLLVIPFVVVVLFVIWRRLNYLLRKFKLRKVSPNIEAAPNSTVTLNSPSVSQSVVQPASTGLISYGITIVSRASAHSRVSAHVPNFKGSPLQLPYKYMEFISRVSTHAGQNHELYLSAHGPLPWTLRYM